MRKMEYYVERPVFPHLKTTDEKAKAAASIFGSYEHAIIEFDGEHATPGMTLKFFKSLINSFNRENVTDNKPLVVVMNKPDTYDGDIKYFIFEKEGDKEGKCYGTLRLMPVVTRVKTKEVSTEDEEAEDEERD